MSSDDDLMTRKAAADLLGCSPKTIRDWVEKKVLRAAVERRAHAGPGKPGKMYRRGDVVAVGLERGFLVRAADGRIERVK